jgi:hypothetical protein
MLMACFELCFGYLFCGAWGCHSILAREACIFRSFIQDFISIYYPLSLAAFLCRSALCR